MFTSVKILLLLYQEGTFWHSGPQTLLEIKQFLEEVIFHLWYIFNEIVMEPEINLKNVIIFIQ